MRSEYERFTFSRTRPDASPLPPEVSVSRHPSTSDTSLSGLQRGVHRCSRTLQGSRSDCSFGSRLCGGRLRTDSGIGQVSSPSLGDALGRTPHLLRVGGSECVSAHTRLRRSSVRPSKRGFWSRASTTVAISVCPLPSFGQACTAENTRTCRRVHVGTTRAMPVRGLHPSEGKRCEAVRLS